MTALLKLFGWLGLLLQVVPSPLPPKNTSGTVSATITLRDVDVAELIEKLELKLGYAIGGKVTVKASLSVPLADATNSNAYVVRGAFTSPELRLEGLRVQNVSADVDYADGRLVLSELKASLPPDTPADKPGTLTGSANAQLSPRGDLSAKLTFTRLPLGEALKAVPGGVAASGVVTGTADFKAPVDTINDPATWTGSAEFSAPTLTAEGRTIKDAKATIDLKKGTASVSDASGVVEGIPLTGSGTLTLTNKYPFTASVRTRPQAVSELQKLVPELALPVAIKGKLETDATAEGTLNPLSVTASGNVSASDLSIGDSPGDKLTARWKLTPERLVVSDLSAGLFKGTVTGNADVPLVEAAKGEFKVAFKEVDAGGVAKAFPAVPVKLTGRVSGDVGGTIPVAKKGEPRAIAADVNLTADTLTVQGIPTEKLTGKLSLDGMAVKYELEGKTLGGSFEVNGRYPEREPGKEPLKDKEPGLIRLRGIDLGRLAEALRLPVPLRGVLDFTFTHSGDFQNGNGRYTIRGLGFGRERLVSELAGSIRLRNGVLEAGDVVGPLSGGTLRARVRARLSDPTRNFFRMDVDRLDAGRLLAVFTGLDREFVEGGVSLRARGKFYPEFQVSGTLGLSRGKVAGLSASDVRLPFDLAVRERGGNVSVRDATGAVGDGRVSGRFEYAWGASGKLDGQLKFTSVKAGTVLRDYKQANYFGGARLTGQIDLTGDNVQSADDLKGSVVATIGQAATRDLPVIASITPFVSPTALLKPFDSGELRGRLSRGVFRIERLTLASPTTDLYADGTVTLGGRLDLGVIVRTGTIGLNDSLLKQVGLALPLPGGLPVELARDVSIFLSNRTVRLNITGTVADPRPQVNTAALIADEAIRFLLRRYVPTAAAVLPEVSPRSTR